MRLKIPSDLLVKIFGACAGTLVISYTLHHVLSQLGAL